MRRWILTVCALTLLTAGAWAAEDPALDRALTALDPAAAAMVDPEAEDMGLAAGVSRLIRSAWEEAKDYLLAGGRSAAAILAGTILLGAAESLAAGTGAERWVPAAGALWVTAAAAGDVNALIGLGRETVEAMAVTGRTLLPVLGPLPPPRAELPPPPPGRRPRSFFSNCCWGLWRGCCCP